MCFRHLRHIRNVGVSRRHRRHHSGMHLRHHRHAQTLFASHNWHSERLVFAHDVGCRDWLLQWFPILSRWLLSYWYVWHYPAGCSWAFRFWLSRRRHWCLLVYLETPNEARKDISMRPLIASSSRTIREWRLSIFVDDYRSWILSLRGRRKHFSNLCMLRLVWTFLLSGSEGVVIRRRYRIPKLVRAVIMPFLNELRGCICMIHSG